MKKQFCSYEIALKLKELGFDETCFGIYLSGFAENEFNTASPQCLFSSKVFIDRQKTGGYCNSTSYATAAPLWQQCLNWFKEKHDILICVSSYKKDKHLYQLMGYDSVELSDISEWIDSYEKAREQAILKALTLIK